MRRALILSGLLLLQACHSVESQYQSIRRNPNDYHRSTSTPYLVMPPSVTSSLIGEDEMVPPINGPSSFSFCLLPPKSMAQKIERGELPKEVLKQRGPFNHIEINPHSQIVNLIIDEETEESWKVLKNALKSQGFRVLQVSAATNIIYFLDPYATQGLLTLKTPLYQAHIVPDRGMTTVYLTDNNGNYVSNSTSMAILVKIQRGFRGESRSTRSKFLPPGMFDFNNKHRLTVG